MYQTDNHSDAVREIQNFLRTIQIANGENVSVPVDGIYDDATRDAVRKFQQQQNLPVTGAVDPTTFSALYESFLKAENTLQIPLPLYIFPNNTIVGPGDEYDLVRIIQIILNVLSVAYDDFNALENTGVYDTETANAVRRFQVRNFLPASSNVDKPTWNALIQNFNKYYNYS